MPIAAKTQWRPIMRPKAKRKGPLHGCLTHVPIDKWTKMNKFCRWVSGFDHAQIDFESATCVILLGTCQVQRCGHRMVIITKVAFFAQYKPGDWQTSASARSSKAKTSNSLNSRKCPFSSRNSWKSGRIVREHHGPLLISHSSWDCSAIKVRAGLTFWGQSLGLTSHHSPWKKCRGIICLKKKHGIWWVTSSMLHFVP